MVMESIRRVCEVNFVLEMRILTPFGRRLFDTTFNHPSLFIVSTFACRLKFVGHLWSTKHVLPSVAYETCSQERRLLSG